MTDSIGQHYLRTCLRNFQSLKALGDRVLMVINDQSLHEEEENQNSLAILFQHISGNLLSRWTDFLTTDGEKPDRNRDGEFENKRRSLAQTTQCWEKGWQTLFDTIESLDADQLMQTITIRGENHTVTEAIQRALSHYAYHIGQLVYRAKRLHGDDSWPIMNYSKGNYSLKI